MMIHFLHLDHIAHSFIINQAFNIINPQLTLYFTKKNM